MGRGEEVARTFLVKVNGAALPPAVAATLVGARVDQSYGIPDLFELRFTDPEKVVLAQAGFHIGAAVQISIARATESVPKLLLEGEVTGFEAETGATVSYTTIRGLDVGHRLHRGTRVRSYLKMTASDIAKQVASTHGLQPVVDNTTAVMEHTAQAAESDWQFLSRLARQHDRVLTVADKKLHFVEPKQAADAPSGGDSRRVACVLEPDRNLISVRVTVSATAQVGQVQVRGWDPLRKEAVVSQQECRTRSARADNADETPAGVVAKLGGNGAAPYLVGDARISKTNLAEASAKSLADHLAGGTTELEGIAHGDPDLRAGGAIKLVGMGDHFGGQYVLTSARHEYRQEFGYRTYFVASNTSERSLYGSAHASSSAEAPIVGITPAVVTNVKDPEKLGRVKVKVPWLSDDYESEWARTLQLGAGQQRGLVILPEVDDEVLVGFAHGDLGHPYVLGGVFNGKDKPVEGSTETESQGRVARRGWTSRKGMKVLLVDQQGEERVEISTNDGAQKIVLQQSKKGIEIISEGPVQVTAKQDVSVKATQNVKVEGLQVEVAASTSLKLKGATVDVESQGPLTLKGAIVRIN